MRMEVGQLLYTLTFWAVREIKRIKWFIQQLEEAAGNNKENIGDEIKGNIKQGK